MALNCVEVSVNVDEAVLTSAMADCITDLMASVNSETICSMHALRAGVPASPSPALTMRRATDRTASLAACDMPGKSKIRVRAPASTSPSSVSSNSISCISSRYFLPSSVVRILGIMLGTPLPLPLYVFRSSSTLLPFMTSADMLPLSAVLGGAGLRLGLGLGLGVGVGVGVSSGHVCFPFVVLTFDAFLGALRVVSVALSAGPSFWLALASFLASLVLGLLVLGLLSKDVCFGALLTGAMGLLPLRANILGHVW